MIRDPQPTPQSLLKLTSASGEGDNLYSARFGLRIFGFLSLIAGLAFSGLTAAMLVLAAIWMGSLRQRTRLPIHLGPGFPAAIAFGLAGVVLLVTAYLADRVLDTDLGLRWTLLVKVMLYYGAYIALVSHQHLSRPVDKTGDRVLGEEYPFAFMGFCLMAGAIMLSPLLGGALTICGLLCMLQTHGREDFDWAEADPGLRFFSARTLGTTVLYSLIVAWAAMLVGNSPTEFDDPSPSTFSKVARAAWLIALFPPLALLAIWTAAFLAFAVQFLARGFRLKRDLQAKSDLLEEMASKHWAWALLIAGICLWLTKARWESMGLPNWWVILGSSSLSENIAFDLPSVVFP
jgi:hypothetical protein